MFKSMVSKMVCVLSLVSLASAAISLKLPYKECAVQNVRGYAEFSNADISCMSGAPALPAYIVRFLLPPDADMATARISFSNLEETVVDGEFLVNPVLPAMSTAGTVAKITDRNIVEGKDVAIYSSNAFYPADYAKIASTGKLLNFQLLEVIVYPYRYNPVTMKLSKVVSGMVEITYDKLRTKPVFNYPTPLDIRERARRLAINYEDVAPAYGSTVLSDPPILNNFMVVTTKAVKEGIKNFDAYIAARTSAGFTMFVVLEDEWGGGTGDVAAENLRKYLKSFVEMTQLSYVLLIGDPKNNLSGVSPAPTPGTLAQKVTKPSTTITAEQGCVPTDYYFSDLSGNWDLDGDGKFGEAPAGGSDQDFGTGGVDNYGEVAVGRIPIYDNAYDTAAKILEKSIAYITQTNVDWRKSALLVPVQYSTSELNWKVMEAVKTEGCVPAGFTSYRIYEQAYGVSPEKVGVSYTNVTTEWKRVPYGICNYAGHGNWSSCVNIIRNTDANQFTNNNPSIVVAATCYNSMPEQKNSVAHAILKRGGIAVIAGARETWYAVSSDDVVSSVTPSNQVYAYRPAKQMINDKLRIGQALNEVAAQCDWVNNTDFIANIYSYGIFGDPAMNLYAEAVGIEHNSKAKNTVRPQVVYLRNSIQFRQAGFLQGNVLLRIYDLKGKVVFDMTKTITPNAQSVSWNMTTNNNQPVSNGLYVATLQYTGPDGKYQLFKTNIVVKN